MASSILADCSDFIAKWEGFSSTPYQDIVGVWTIGYGSTHGVTKDTLPITREQGLEMLEIEIASYYRRMLKLVSVPLSDGQKVALTSFCYNLGIGAFQRSTLRAKLNRREYEEARAEFRKWCKAGGRVVKGLVLRRRAEAELFT